MKNILIIFLGICSMTIHAQGFFIPKSTQSSKTGTTIPNYLTRHARTTVEGTLNTLHLDSDSLLIALPEYGKRICVGYNWQSYGNRLQLYIES